MRLRRKTVAPPSSSRGTSTPSHRLTRAHLDPHHNAGRLGQVRAATGATPNKNFRGKKVEMPPEVYLTPNTLSQKRTPSPLSSQKRPPTEAASPPARPAASGLRTRNA